MIALVDYGAGNLRSVEFALLSLGVPWSRAGDSAAVADASAIILPGVGAAASAMSELRERGLDGALLASKVPLLGICLGMQLLTDRSDEGRGEVACLGFIRGSTRPFGCPCPGETRRSEVPFPHPVPHIGWNDTRLVDDPIFDGLEPVEHFYFLHSYRVCVNGKSTIAETDYGERFPAAIRFENRIGVQFHPEKSGPAGLRLLANFCRSAGLG